MRIFKSYFKILLYFIYKKYIPNLEYIHAQRKRIQIQSKYQFIKVDIDNPVCERTKETQILEQFFGLCGRGRGWDDLGEWH